MLCQFQKDLHKPGNKNNGTVNLVAILLHSRDITFLFDESLHILHKKSRVCEKDERESSITWDVHIV